MIDNRVKQYRQLSVGFLACLLIASVGCKKTTTTSTTTQQQAVILGPENFVIVGETVIENGPLLSGTLVPRERATVRAQIAGSVLRASAEQGQAVGQGAILAFLDDRAIADQVASARAGVTNAESSLGVAEREENRQAALVKAGAVAQRDYENSRKNTIAARAAVEQARAQLVSAQKQLSNTRAVAPFSGVVSEKLVNTGDVVQAGTALYSIVDPSSMELEATIPAEQLNMIRVGLPINFTVTGYPNRVFTGHITRINPTADPATRQVRVYAEIPNTGRILVSDLYAEGRISAELKTAIGVPTTAIDRRYLKPSVVRVRNGRTERVDVTLGTQDDAHNVVQITSGVNKGDTVLTGTAQQVALGTPIKFTTVQASNSTTAAGTPAGSGSAPASGTQQSSSGAQTSSQSGNGNQNGGGMQSNGTSAPSAAPQSTPGSEAPGSVSGGSTGGSSSNGSSQSSSGSR